MKCDDEICCSPWRSNWLDVVPTRFLSAPFPLKQTRKGVIVPEPKDHIALNDKKTPFANLGTRLSMKMSPKAARSLSEVSYDLFCPKVHMKMKDRSCPECGIYFPTKKAVGKHKKVHNPGGIHVPRPVLTDSESEEEMQMEVSRTTDQIPIITNIFQYMECPWEDNIDIVED